MEDEFFFHHYLPPSHSLSSISLTLSLPSYLVNYSLALEAQCVCCMTSGTPKKKIPRMRAETTGPSPRGDDYCAYYLNVGTTCPGHYEENVLFSLAKAFTTVYVLPFIHTSIHRPGTGLTRTQPTLVSGSNDVSPPHAQWATHRETRQTRTTEVDWKHDSVRGMRRASLLAAGLVGIGSAENAPPPFPPPLKKRKTSHAPNQPLRCVPKFTAWRALLIVLRISLTFTHDITNGYSHSFIIFFRT